MRIYIFPYFSIIAKLGMIVSFFIFLSCATASETVVDEKTDISEIVQNDQYYIGDAGKDIRLAVVPIKKSGLMLLENENWYPELIQGILTNDFTKFSRMEIIDRINLETVLDEQKISMSGDYSDNDYVKIGNLTNAQYILTGSLIKISSLIFRLQLAVINAENGIRFKSYDQECTKIDVQSGIAIKKASEDMLIQMGVNLTETGKIALRGTSIESDTSIARGLAARKTGNSIETLNYYYDAVAFDPSSIEAAKRLSVVQEEIAKNGAGVALRNDIKAQALWDKTLNDYTNFYSNHLPFELVFTQYAIQKSADYSKKTYTLQMTAGLRWTNSVETMQNILNDINEGLEKSGRKDVWGFSNWPNNERLFSIGKDIPVVAEILNDRNETLSSVAFSLTGRLGINENRIYVNTQQLLSVSFPAMSYNAPNEIPDNFIIRIVSISGEDIDTIIENGYVKIKPVSDFPETQVLHPVFAEIENKRIVEEEEKLRQQQMEELERFFEKRIDEENQQQLKESKNRSYTWITAGRNGGEVLSFGLQWPESPILGGREWQAGLYCGLYLSPFPFTSFGLEWRAYFDGSISISPTLGIVFPITEGIFLFSDALLEFGRFTLLETGKFREWNGLITNRATPGFDVGITLMFFTIKYRGIWYEEGYTNAVVFGLFIPFF